MNTTCPALLVAGSASGQGKTTLTAALARRHVRQGRRVRVFKVGPDFLDPMLLAAASGQPVYQLDLWLVGEAQCRRLLFEAAQAADLILIEGVMGLFDGTPSAADLAQTFGIPVLAVIDAFGMAETFGAVAHGLATYRPDLPFAGVVANRVASSSHADRLRASMPRAIPFRGAFFRQPDAGFPDRHLGLVQSFELDDLDRRLDTLADAICGIDLADLPDSLPFAPEPAVAPPRLLQGVRLGIARDEAFSFLYPANLDLLSAMGAKLIFFSPLRDRSLPQVDSLYLPGGYPELHLATLAGNRGMKASLQAHVAAGKPLLAECGGLLYLLEELVAHDGTAGAMCGLLPGRGRMQTRLTGLGLQLASFRSGTLRAHTFHYSRLETPLSPRLVAERRQGGAGEAVYQEGRLTASFLHWYLPSCPEAAAELLRP
ncbi:MULTISPECIES: cobyrinate a,c-diamide synthase [Methylococcus]|uniref:Cobyrinate a,c-diamide synthase n=1 Tax=Methylococcus capsulatus TaxID=414 RepID=A0ABZ2F0N0_METCP|nr:MULTISPECIES: cobyrinate a,c-diamide synthase [Methylococcus]MDF9391519.1 cobyrinate a,c-diamide synthase [Methylococcus capsulatus]